MGKPSKFGTSMNQRPRARVVIADDHKLVAEACKSLLEPEFEVVDIVTDGQALLQSVVKLMPHAVIVDIGMPQLNGLDAGAELKKKYPAVKVIYLTMNTSPSVAAEAFRRGASGYLVKHCSAEELPVAVRRVLEGDSYLSPSITKDTVAFLLERGMKPDPELGISGRQSEILQLLAEGYAMKEVAGILGIKPGTVAFHKYRMMGILGVKTTAGLINYAVQHHMTDANWTDARLAAVNRMAGYH